MLALTILGNNSALPAFGRNPTAQILQTQNEMFLIDCGEGTQLQMSKFKMKKSKLKRIFISHLHGDHYFGLIGLLTSMGLANRADDIHVHAPARLIEIINLQLEVADAHLPYKLYFHPLNEEGMVADSGTMTVEAFRVKHRIECWGFIFREKKNKRSIVPAKANAYEIPSAFYEQLQKGIDYVTAKGTIVPNEEVTIEVAPAKSYAYCADTIFDIELASKIRDVDLLYHETTYLHDLAERAAARFHSTTKQAAEVARAGNAKKLLIGHFSSKYESLDEFLLEARSVFLNTELALEGACYPI